MTIASTTQQILATRLVAIVRSPRPLPIAEALIESGARAVEFSLTELSSLDAISRMSGTCGVSIGAGTVLTVDDARRAVDRGARFLVSPNLDTDVVAWAAARDVLHLPGVFTPTEVVRALSAGARMLKLFPAATLGPSYVAELLAPFPELALVPTGGVNDDNARAFLDAGAVALGVGGALAPRHLLDQPAELRAHIDRFIRSLELQHSKE